MHHRQNSKALRRAVTQGGAEGGGGKGRSTSVLMSYFRIIPRGPGGLQDIDSAGLQECTTKFNQRSFSLAYACTQCICVLCAYMLFNRYRPHSLAVIPLVDALIHGFLPSSDSTEVPPLQCRSCHCGRMTQERSYGFLVTLLTVVPIYLALEPWRWK